MFTLGPDARVIFHDADVNWDDVQRTLKTVNRMDQPLAGLLKEGEFIGDVIASCKSTMNTAVFTLEGTARNTFDAWMIGAYYRALTAWCTARNIVRDPLIWQLLPAVHHAPVANLLELAEQNPHMLAGYPDNPRPLMIQGKVLLRSIV